MPSPVDANTVKLPREYERSSVLRSAKLSYVPGVREPFRLPVEKVQLPPPEPNPSAPPSFNWLTSLFPPLLIVGSMVAMVNLMPGMNSAFMIPMMIMSMGFPIANIIGLVVQKKNYKKSIQERERKYRDRLEKERARLLYMAQIQRQVMEDEYPDAKKMEEFAIWGGENPRLWWRRPQDTDYLALRIGQGFGNASFSVIPPNINDPFDPITSYALQLVQDFEKISNLPFLIDLKRVGSVGVMGPDDHLVYTIAYRMVLDILIHHSPQEVLLSLLTDLDDWATHWEWLKWTPHTRALNPAFKMRFIAFRQGTISDFLDWLTSEFKQRLERSNHFNSAIDTIPIITVIDDRGKIRQHPGLSLILERGWEVGIFLIFIGGHQLPRVRAKVDIAENGQFRYVETWEGGTYFQAQADLVERNKMEAAARSLSRIDLMGDKNSVALPEGMRLSQLIHADLFSPQSVKRNWSLPRSDRELLQFPVGVKVSRDGLEALMINLLPAERGGNDAYHSILIGTTGSGKSEFMKSLVLSAAYKYSPRVLNFFFLDFKGGAAFSVLSELPHVIGIVTNLMPELVERGLDALENEIGRRQEKFAQASVQNIWDYNKISSSEPFSHVLLLLDEFAKGLVDFPRLKMILELLVRQGRSLGMYLILANQDVNPAVDSLLNNTGWRIVLKVARQEEMHIIDKTLPPARRAGQGYLRSLNGDIFEFQAGYAGLPVQTSSNTQVDEFKVFQVEGDGHLRQILHHNQVAQDATPAPFEVIKEEVQFISLMKDASIEMGIEKARPIYLDPLPTEILLSDVLQVANGYRLFCEEHWRNERNTKAYLTIPVGYLDQPKGCQQIPLLINFTEQDGHLWIVGSPGSGKSAVLRTLLTSLAFTHNPEEVNIYILEFGAGELRSFEELPHTGSLIRISEQERLERLFRFLDDQISIRTNSEIVYEDASEKMDEESTLPDTSIPQIFLVINNFAELRSAFPDSIERISRFVRDGKAAGIHLIVTTNRGTELPRSISSNIARRLVLQMAAREEYLEVTQKMVSALTVRSPGRGYWVNDDVLECQVALMKEASKSGVSNHNIKRDPIKLMKQSWKGAAPQTINVIPTVTKLSDALASTEEEISHQTRIPIGIQYENLTIATVDILDELPHWLVVGPRQCGKTNFLASLTMSLLHSDQGNWDVKIFLLRRSPLAHLAELDRRVAIFSTADDIIRETLSIVETINTQSDDSKKLLLLVDDLGIAFDASRMKLREAFDALALKIRDRNDIYLVASGLPDELRTGIATPIIKLLRQSNTGIVFSTDPMVLEWLGVLPGFVAPFRKMELPPGRGFFVSKKARLVQTFLVDNALVPHIKNHPK